MALRIEKTFAVRAAPPAVWDFLTDPRRVARCLPGAAVTEQVDERTYTGTITVKVGPVSASYKGKARFERLDSAGRTAEITAFGQDVRGKGGADVKMTSRLTETGPGQTEVAIASEVNVTGVLAQLGRGMIQDVSDQMFQKFTEAVRAELESAPPEAAAAAGPAPAAPPLAQAPPIEVMSFGAGVLGRAAGRAAANPVTWIATAVVVALVYWLWIR
jgi:hypothetical protein